jgi:hypothetical protein
VTVLTSLGPTSTFLQDRRHAQPIRPRAENSEGSEASAEGKWGGAGVARPRTKARCLCRDYPDLLSLGPGPQQR